MSALEYEQFCELAAAYSVVPLHEEFVADAITPVGAFLTVVGEGDGFLLESVEHGERFSRYSFVGRSPVSTIVAHGRELSVVEGSLPERVPLDQGILACLEEVLSCYRSPKLDGLPPMHGGLVGYLGYDVVREIEHLGEPPFDDRAIPDAVVSIVGEVVAFDHWKSRATLIDNVVLADREVMSDVELRAAYQHSLGNIAALRADLERPVAE